MPNTQMIFLHTSGPYLVTDKGLKPMASKKKIPTRSGRINKLPRKNKVSRVPVDVSEIEFGEDMEIPPIVKDSKYPWDELTKYEPLKKNFFVPTGTGEEGKEEAERIRGQIFTSGRNYYLKRKMQLFPVVRVGKNKDDVWGIYAWAKMEEEVEE